MICARGGAEEEKEEEPGYRIKNKNPTQRCGERHFTFGAFLEVEMSKKCTLLWCETHLQDFASEKAKNTTPLEHFWKLRCRKSARCCGAKHISKSKCTKHTTIRPFLEVEMSKKCTLLWREAHFKVKMYKAQHVRTTFGCSDVVLRGRRKGLWTLSKVSKT